MVHLENNITEKMLDGSQHTGTSFNSAATSFYRNNYLNKDFFCF